MPKAKLSGDQGLIQRFRREMQRPVSEKPDLEVTE
jgi:hypothetical protein